jgi:ATP-dependent Zn protease
LGVNIKQSIVALLIILTFSVYFVSVQQAIAQADQATSKMQAANDAVKRAFNAVLDAEKAGANVIGLLAQINTVQGILAQAENSYRTGNTNSAAAQADNVFSIAQQITTVAQNAKQDAIISSQNNFWLTIAFTVVSTIMFLEALILFWLWFKRRYIKNLSEAKPEVVNNET